MTPLLTNLDLAITDYYLPEYRKKCADLLLNKTEKWQKNTEKMVFSFYLQQNNLARNPAKIGFHTPKSMEHFVFVKKKIQTLNAVYAQLQEKNLNLTHLETLISLHNQFYKQENKGHRGVRIEESWISNAQGVITYIPIPAAMVPKALTDFFSEIQFLLQQKMPIVHAFYYAAYIHLIFVTIHPFEDGNGRTARLFEKWFLVQKLGEWAWNLPTEKFYWFNRIAYFGALQSAKMQKGGVNKNGVLDFLLLFGQGKDNL